jgi:hypothetical protein
VAVAAATSRDRAAVERYRDVVDELAVRLAGLNVRAPALARKAAPLEATSRKLAHLAYELSLAEGSVFAGLVGGGGADVEQGAGPGAELGESAEF